MTNVCETCFMSAFNLEDTTLPWDKWGANVGLNIVADAECEWCFEV